MKKDINNELNLFIELIRILESISATNIRNRLRIRRLIKKTRKKFTVHLQNTDKFDVKDICNFISLIDVCKRMKIINNTKIDTDAYSVSISIYNIKDFFFLGGVIDVSVIDNKNNPITKSIFKTLITDRGKPFLDVSLDIFKESFIDYNDTIDIKSYHVTDVQTIYKKQNNNNGEINNVVLNSSFIILQNIILAFYNYIFNEMEGKYLYEKEKKKQ